tara:strand:- start:836 stop:1372 length:537 start_codon:yes stop_codon:yes gene_type:complete
MASTTTTEKPNSQDVAERIIQGYVDTFDMYQKLNELENVADKNNTSSLFAGEAFNTLYPDHPALIDYLRESGNLDSLTCERIIELERESILEISKQYEEEDPDNELYYERDAKAIGGTILLGTGGPAHRIIGKIDLYDSLVKCELQHQDWYTPWVSLEDLTATQSEALEWFANLFYWG